MKDQGKSALTRFAIIAAASVTVIVVLWVYMGQNSEETAAQQPSTEWTTAPTEGVEVDLPDTPLRNVPAETQDYDDDTNGEDDGRDDGDDS